MTNLNAVSGAYAKAKKLGDMYAVEAFGKSLPASLRNLQVGSRESAREVFFTSKVHLPYIYGYHVLGTDTQDRTTKANGWVRYGDNLFRVFMTYWYSTKGNGHTVVVNVSRKVDDGRVSVSSSVRDAGADGLGEFIAKLVRINARKRKATRPSIKRAFSTAEGRPERGLVKEDWSV